MYPKAALTLVLCAVMMVSGGLSSSSQQLGVTEKESHYTIKPIYVRVAAIYTGVVNGQWAVTTELLKKYGHTYVGRKMLLGHEWGDPMAAVGTIVAAKVKHNPRHKKDYLEVIVRIDDPIAISKIKRKLFHFVSIGFTYSRAVNSIDGQKWKAGDIWNYTPGRIYTVTKVVYMPVGLFQWARVNVNTEVRAVAIIEDMQGQEISFVNVPASRYARVLEYSKKKLAIN